MTWIMKTNGQGYYDNLNQLSVAKIGYGFDIGEELSWFRYIHRYYEQIRQAVVKYDHIRFQNDEGVEFYIHLKNERDFFRNLINKKIYGVTWMNMWRLWLSHPDLKDSERQEILQGILECRRTAHYSKSKLIDKILKEFKLLDGNRQL